MFGRNTKVISNFLKVGYCDSNLAKLLRAAERGKVNYVSSTACLLGRADDAERYQYWYWNPPVANALNCHECLFGKWLTNKVILVWLIKREMKRRSLIVAEGRQLTMELSRPAEPHQEQASEKVGTSKPLTTVTGL